MTPFFYDEFQRRINLNNLYKFFLYSLTRKPPGNIEDSEFKIQCIGELARLSMLHHVSVFIKDTQLPGTDLKAPETGGH